MGSDLITVQWLGQWHLATLTDISDVGVWADLRGNHKFFPNGRWGLAW